LSESGHAASISHGFIQCKENIKKANAQSCQKSLREFKDTTALLQEVFSDLLTFRKTQSRNLQKFIPIVHYKDICNFVSLPWK